MARRSKGVSSWKSPNADSVQSLVVPWLQVLIQGPVHRRRQVPFLGPSHGEADDEYAIVGRKFEVYCRLNDSRRDLHQGR